jgi:serine/threonine-protein kinase RsbW
MSNESELVTLVVPAQPDYLRLARLASADSGSRAGFDYEEIDDLRIAVSELCHLLIGSGARGSMTLEFHSEPNAVVIEGAVAEPGDGADNEFTDTILDTVADEHSITDGADGRRFRLVKRRR